MQPTPPPDSLTTNRRWEQVWDRIWQQKGWLWRGVAIARDRYNDLGKRLLTRYLEPGDRLLELGCGTSQLTLSLAPQLKDLVGLDISDEALRLARAHQAKLGVTNATFVK
ncbi:MAG: methyltransferase domain-containing protein, partial [Candidatus Andersenbacteria bacterium]